MIQPPASSTVTEVFTARIAFAAASAVFLTAAFVLPVPPLTAFDMRCERLGGFSVFPCRFRRPFCCLYCVLIGPDSSAGGFDLISRTPEILIFRRYLRLFLNVGGI